MPQLLARAASALLVLALSVQLHSVAFAQDDPPEEVPLPGELVVYVTDEDGEPLFKAGVHIAPTQAEWDAIRRNGGFGASTLGGRTDPDGAITIELPPGEERELTVTSRDGTAERFETTLEAFEPGERRELDVALRTKDDATFRGLLVDVATGEPVAGAVIRAEPKSGFSTFGGRTIPVRAPSHPSAVTDEDGSFQVAAATWREARLEIFAEGYSLRRALVGGTEDAPGLDDPATVGMSKERVLVVAVQGPSKGLAIRAEFSVPTTLRDATAKVDYRLRDQVALAAESSGEVGVFLIRGLPTTGLAEIVFERGREVVHSVRGVALDGAPGETVVEVDLRAEGRVAGRVTREDGSPVVGQEVWIGGTGGSSSTKFASYIEPTQRVTTGDDGQFEFNGLVRDRYLVAYPAESALGGDPEGRICQGRWVDLRTNAEAPRVELVEVQGLSIRGILRAPDGTPHMGHITASLRGEDGHWGAQTNNRSDDGAFVLGPLLPGTYSVSSMGDRQASYASSVAVTVDAGATDVEVHLRPAGRVRGFVTRAGTSKPAAADLRFIDGETRLQWLGTVEADGTFEFLNVPAGEHHLFARTDDGWVSELIAIEVAAGEILDEIPVDVDEGGLVVVRQTGGRDYSLCRVEREGTLYYAQNFTEDGAAKLSLPPGPATVTVTNKSTGGTATFEVDVRPGETVERTVSLASDD